LLRSNLDLYSTPWSIGAKVYCRPSHCEGVGSFDIALKVQASQGDWQPHHPAIPHVGKILIKVAQKGPCQENEREKTTKKPLIAYAVEFVEGNFPRNQALQDRRIVRVKETEGEGSRARGARQGERHLRPICGCAATTPLKRLPREPDPGWWRILMPARYTRRWLCYWLHRLDTTHTKSANVSAVPFRGGVG